MQRPEPLQPTEGGSAEAAADSVNGVDTLLGEGVGGDVGAELGGGEPAGSADVVKITSFSAVTSDVDSESSTGAANDSSCFFALCRAARTRSFSTFAGFFFLFP